MFYAILGEVFWDFEPASVKIKKLNPSLLFDSVLFGSVLAAIGGLYIALGWARPWLGGWFDRTDAQYFNAWPLKVIGGLLIINLMAITWRRVPLTVRGFGIWCIAAGIIILLGGLSLQAGRGVNGAARIYLDPSVGPATVDRFDDKDERSLFIRLGQEAPVEIHLAALPRFAEYDPAHAHVFADRGLVGIEPGVESDPASGQGHVDNLAELVGCTGQKLTVDVAGYYPNAVLSTEFASDSESLVTGVKMICATSTKWMVGSDARFRVNEDFCGAGFQHLEVDATGAAGVTDAATKMTGPDGRLKTDAHLHDPFQLLPVRKKVRHTFLTPPGGNELVDIVAEPDSTGITIRRFPTGIEEVASDPKMRFERQDHIRLVDTVAAMPASTHNKPEWGSNQVIVLKLMMGEWSTMLNVPFAADAGSHLAQDQWRGGVVRLPGAVAPLQFQLGGSLCPLPAALTLLEGRGINPSNAEFTFSLTDPITGALHVEKVKLNESFYYAGGKWAFCPTAYDATGKWVEVTVQSRPALWLIVGGGSLIVIGTVYWLFVRLILRSKKHVTA